MRRLRVKVTTDIWEYKKWRGDPLLYAEGTRGLYCNGYIWVEKLSPLLLFHEFIHHLIGYSEEPWYISPRLFADFLNTLWDASYYRLTRIRAPKERNQEALRRLKESWNVWLDWVLCR